ncbi:hypothetical protein EON64_08935, partial [archaeon]
MSSHSPFPPSSSIEQVAMTSKQVIREVWQLLTGPCGLSPKEARSLVARCPHLLGPAVARGSAERLRVLEEEGGLVAPYQFFSKALLRFPLLLRLDSRTHLRPNIRTLQRLLE